MEIDAKIVGWDESREVEAVKDEDGRVTELKPVPGSEKMTLHLQLPTGAILKAQVVDNADVDALLMPLIPSVEGDVLRG